MANQKVPQLPVLTAVTGDDLFYVVDIHDTTDDPTGSSKQITRDNLLKNITGLTVNGNVNITGNTYVTGVTNTNGVTSTGGITFKQVTINSTYSATTQDYMIDVTGGTFTVYLPSAVGIQGRLLVVKNNGGGAVTVQPISGQDIDGKPYVILGETNTIQLASNGTNWVAISYNISTVNSSTGVFSFTGLTIASPTTFTVAPVKGWIVDDTTNPLSPQLYYVYYSGGTYTATYVTTATETWVYLTSGGTISQSNVLLTDQQRRQNIYLGKLGHANKTNIINAFSQPDFVLSPLSQLRDMFDPIGLINEGITPSANGANLSFNTSAGYLHGLGINFASDTLNPNAIYVSGTSPCTFQYRTQTGGTASNTTFIDPTVYDVGGVVTSIPGAGGRATNQRIYLVQNGVFRVQYGQTFYNSLAAAVAGIATEPFVEFSNFQTNGILVGVLSVSKAATDLSDTTKALFFNVSKFGDSTGAAGGAATTTLQQAYDNSVNPEITTNSTLGAVSIKNGAGTADNVTSLFETLNSGGTTTMFIRADGSISATTITATTVSATTYQNLPVDPNYYVTAVTFSNNVLTIKQNGQSDLTALINTVTGWTVNGNLTVTGTTTSNIVSATTISGTTFYGNGTNLTGVVKGSGTSNYLPRWTGTTALGNSIIQDDGTNIGINTSPNSAYRVFVNTVTAGQIGGYFQSYNIGIQGVGSIDNGTVYGVYGLAQDNGNPFVTSVYIGGRFYAAGGTGTNYSLWLQDGTEGINKVLVSQTADGKSNWSSTLSGLTTVRSTSISGGTLSGGTVTITTTPTTNNTNTQALARNPSTGVLELVDLSSIPSTFNYGLANAIMTGNYLT